MSYDTATIIILDIGKNTTSSEKEESFFETARKCAYRIIERNIMIQGKPLLGVILMGAKSRNALAEECPGAFKNIELHAELNKPSWQMIRDLPQETTDRKADWFEALIVAAHHYKTSSLKIKGAKKIVLMTNFAAPARIGNNFNEVVIGFKEEDFEVFVIGPNIEESESKDIDLIKELIDKTNGETATFQEAMSSWLFHKHKVTINSRGMCYKMFIGPHLTIPVTAHIKVKDEPVMKESWQKSISDVITGTSSKTEAVVVNRKIVNPEDQTETKPENTVTSYIFGQKVIPFTLDKNELLKKYCYRSPMAVVIHGFTKKENIQWQCLNGDVTHYVTSKKNDKRAQDVIKCLVHCMLELGVVAIARQQFLALHCPKMVALMPVIDNNGLVCLSCIKLCYKEEIKNMAFPSVEVKKYACNNEQVNAFKELIKAMDLMKAYDDSFNDEEAFPVGETVSPSLQYTLDCVAYRAMNPGKPLPQPRDEIMTLFKVPPLVEKRSREPLEALKKLLVLKKVEKPVSNRKKTHQQISDFNAPGTSNQNGDTDMPKVKLPALLKKEEDVEHVGTLKPSNDFISLLGKGKSLAELAPEMTEVIESIVYTNIVGDRTKVLDAMKIYREECVKNGPAHYNDWLKKFKRNLLERKRDVIINIINENKLNFILSSENGLSTYTEENSHEDSQMYDNDTMPNSTELSIRTDVNDLFDEM